MEYYYNWYLPTGFDPVIRFLKLSIINPYRYPLLPHKIQSYSKSSLTSQLKKGFSAHTYFLITLVKQMCLISWPPGSLVYFQLYVQQIVNVEN